MTKILEEGTGNPFDTKWGSRALKELEANVQAPPLFKQHKRQTFEQFLQEKHAEDYHGTDDNMPDAYDHWCSELDVQEVMDFAQQWGDTLV